MPTSVALAPEDVDVAGCGGVVDPRAQYHSMRECMLLSERTVRRDLQQRYRQLAVFGEDVVISSDVLAVLWGVSATAARSDCNMLLDRHLVMLAKGGGGRTGSGAVHVMLHDLQRGVLVHEARGVGLSVEDARLDAAAPCEAVL